jgi:hypothetical protein
MVLSLRATRSLVIAGTLTTVLLTTVMLSGCAAAEPSLPTPSGSPAPSDRGAAVPECPDGGTDVATADELQDALDDARPGDVITLADGHYEGSFVVTASGEAGNPIHLCGGPGAVLDGGGVDDGTVMHLDGARHWVLLGFTVQNGKKGVMADGVEHTVIGGLTVRDIGDEAIHLRKFSSDNVVVGNTIVGTGLREPEFGEGIYVGTAESNWCDISDCEPDRSDRNVLAGNALSETTSESIDVKEGTTGGVIRDNDFDGSALSGEADSWVDVKGNGWLIEGNRGIDSPGDGFQTHEILEGWGTDNVFRANLAEVNGPGFGYALTPELGNIVACYNVARGADGGMSNVECSSA